MTKPTPATVIACIALFFSLGGAGLAAHRYLITSTSQIKPSVRHKLRSHAGPAGPRGPAGPQGTAGDPATVSFEQLPGNTVTIAPGGSATSTAACPKSHGAAIGGSFVGDPGISVYSSRNSITRGGLHDWLVSAQNPTASPLTLTATAICAH